MLECAAMVLQISLLSTLSTASVSHSHSRPHHGSETGNANVTSSSPSRGSQLIGSRVALKEPDFLAPPPVSFGMPILQCSAIHFMLALATSCSRQRVLYGLSLELEHCVIGTQGAGLVIIKSRLPAKQRLDIFHVGPEIAILPIRYCSGRYAIGNYRLAWPGGYHVEVLKLYDRFNYDGYNFVNISEFRVGSFDVEVATPGRNKPHQNNLGDECQTGYESESAVNAGPSPSSCPPCRSQDEVRGHWLAPRPENVLLLHHTCVWTMTSLKINASHGIPMTGLEYVGVQECHLKFQENNRIMSTWASANDNNILTWRSQQCQIRPPPKHLPDGHLASGTSTSASLGIPTCV